MSRQMLDHDPLTGTTEWFETHADGSWSIHTQQNCTDILEVAAFERNAIDGDRFGEMACVGYIPMTMLMAMPADMRNGNDQKALKRWLIENSKLLVRNSW